MREGAAVGGGSEGWYCAVLVLCQGALAEGMGWLAPYARECAHVRALYAQGERRLGV